MKTTVDVERNWNFDHPYNVHPYNVQYNTNLLLSIMTPNILSRTIKWITYIWFHVDWFDWFYNKERKKDNITNE